MSMLFCLRKLFLYSSSKVLKSLKYSLYLCLGIQFSPIAGAVVKSEEPKYHFSGVLQ